VTVYTHGTWIVKPGREDEFVAAWRELGAWTLGRIPAAHGTLLRDREIPNRFVSFGPWESIEVIESWRADPEFQRRVGAMRELLESFEPWTMDPVAEVRR
jgi:quinol monooxygenase YgiN